jgi:hypothetical protein
MSNRPEHAFKMRHPYRRRILAAAALALAATGIGAGIADPANAESGVIGAAALAAALIAPGAAEPGCLQAPSCRLSPQVYR